MKLKALNAELEDLRTDLAMAKQDLNNSNQQITTLNAKVEDLESELAKAKTVAVETKSVQKPETKSQVNEAGLSFRVQIGGYKNRDLSSFNNPRGELVKVEANSLGTQEITLGRFTSYRKTDEFKKHLRAMGLKDAWIVPYRDGQRVPLKDVVDELDIQKP